MFKLKEITPIQLMIVIAAVLFLAIITVAGLGKDTDRGRQLNMAKEVSLAVKYEFTGFDPMNVKDKGDCLGSGMVAADFNGDGKPDIALVTGCHIITLLENKMPAPGK